MVSLAAGISGLTGIAGTFFAVMASFTNPALSSIPLGTRYLNELYAVPGEVRHTSSGRPSR